MDGWPWRCVWHRTQRLSSRLGLPNAKVSYDATGVLGFRTTVGASRRALHFQRQEDLVRLSYNPIWSGLIGNTAVYGGAWFGVLVGIGYWRRVRRLRRGRCPVCRYELVEGGCPECGWNREEKRLATGDERLGGRG